jgi:hypothetical protein
MNSRIVEKLKNWDDWSFEGTEHHQFLSFKILSLDEKLEATEDLACTVQEFLERARQRKEKTHE